MKNSVNLELGSTTYSQRFMYPIRKKKMVDTLSYIREHQEALIIRRINMYLNRLGDSDLVDYAHIGDISFDYEPQRNNSHLDRIPFKDRMLEKYQGINTTISINIEVFFKNSLNYSKMKNYKKYEEIVLGDNLKECVSTEIFRSIMDSNIDDLF